MYSLVVNPLKIHYPKFSFMRGVEHTVSLFFNDAFKTPVVNQMITAHMAIKKLFGSDIYHKPHYCCKWTNMLQTRAPSGGA